MKIFLLSLVTFFIAPTTLFAQDNSDNKYLVNGIFNHLDLSVTAGTTGIGIDVASPIGDMFQLRGGFAIMPRVNYKMHFTVQVGDDPATSQSKFDRLNNYYYELFETKVDNHITMIGRPTYSNFNLFLDVFPFKNNRHWHFSAGFFLGKEEIADAINDLNASQALVAINMYNNNHVISKMYDKILEEIMSLKDDPSTGPPHIEIDGQRIDFDPDFIKGVQNKLSQVDKERVINSILQKYNLTERMAIPIGTFNKTVTDSKGVVHNAGEVYYMEPDVNCTVSAKGYSNVFKPYLGFGYGGRLLKKSDRYYVSFDCGAMFWGGSPDIITHEGINITKDLDNIRGDVGDYVDTFNKFKVMPVLNVRFTKRIF